MKRLKHNFKKGMAFVLSLAMVAGLVPAMSGGANKVQAASGSGTKPSVSAYATKEQLMTAFTPDSNANATTIGKLVFGKNSSSNPQKWYILGKDEGVSGDNTIIFAASPIATGKQFNSSTSNKTYNYGAGTGYGDSEGSKKVYANHYGASDLRVALRGMASNTNYFTTAEQGLMNATTVKTKDKNNSVTYTTTDKLYALQRDYYNDKLCAGTSDSTVLAMSSYWSNGYCFWLRSPDDDSSSHALLASPVYAVISGDVLNENAVQPASNLNLSSVLFASAAKAASSDTVSNPIASETAMTLRFDGTGKNIGTVTYNATTGDIKAAKGSTSQTVALVVQGNDGTKDWYYSKQIDASDTINVSDIVAKLITPTSIDLSACKIWLETTDSTENLIYAVGATEILSITSVAITDIETPAPNTSLDTGASCVTEGVSSTTPQITWAPNDSTAGYNTSYIASITLTADTGYEFTDSTTATVLGNSATSVTKNADGTLTVTYNFPATAKDKLTSITAPQAIIVANGTAYSAMNLPATVNIVTEGNTVSSASVTWNTTTPANGSYDPAVLTQQTVTLNGTVARPDSIDANGVELTTTITITISAAGIVGAPTANPTAGKYTENQSVALTSSTEGATIYYTTDGSEPTITGGTTQQYTAPIAVTGKEGQSITTTIKAIAVKSGMQDSSVEAFTYTIQIPVPKYANVFSVDENNHKITASCLSHADENGGSLTISAPEAPVGQEKITYDGKAKEAIITNTISDVTPKVTYTYKAVGAAESKPLSEGEIPTKAGTYTASVSLTGADGETATVSVSYQIDKATPTLTWADPATGKTITYTGQEITTNDLPPVTVGLQNGETYEGEIQYSYRKISDGSTSGSGDFSADIPKEVGAYEVKASIAADGNYTAAETSDTRTIKITKATPVIAEKPTASVLTYGQKLSDSTLTGGKATYNTGTEVAGTFAWKNGDTKPTAADSGTTEYDVTFIPSDTHNYNVVDTKLTLTVNKAATVPNMPGNTMAPAHSTNKVGDITLPEGWIWQEADRDKKLADGVGVMATAEYTGADKGNYNQVSVQIVITRSTCNHTHTEIRKQQEATCTQTGYTGDSYCTDCKKLLSTGKELAALGHDYKATVTKQPTTTEEGIRTYTCTRCNSSYTESIAKLPEEQHTHNYTGSITKEATCTEAGVRTYTCSCGDSYTENIPATGHSYVSKVTKAATTTEEGIMTYTCSKCGHSYTQPIAKIKSDDSSKEGWDVIKPQLEEAKSGDTVTVAMNGTTVVPKDVIDSIKGKDTTLVLDMGNGLSWKINGQDITDAAGDIDFDVTVGADAGKSIPVDLINNVTGEHSSLNLTLAYDGEFGFTATLTVNMESKNAGLYANLFYYNEQTGELEFISAGQIDPDGNVELVFTHASDYTIVVDAKIMSDNGQADNKSDETITAPKTDDRKYAWNNTIIIIIGICIILIVFGAVFYVRKKSGSDVHIS